MTGATTERESFAERMRTAARQLLELVNALPSQGWGDRPWEVDECADENTGNCRCIVYQGETAAWNEPQVPFLQYVADAESEEHATFIAAMNPAVAKVLSSWLLTSAENIDHGMKPDQHAVIAAQAVLAAVESARRVHSKEKR